MLEEGVEDTSRSEAKKRGVIALKLKVISGPGWFDHTLFANGGRIAFLELKRPKGGVFGPLQKWYKRKLRKMGFRVATCYTPESVREFYEEWLGPA